MKKKVLILLISVSILYLWAIEWNLTSTGGTITGRLPQAQITLVKDKTVIAMEGSVPGGQAGAYAWPVISHMVSLDPQGTLAISHQSFQFEEIILDAPLAPFNWQDDDETDAVISTQDAWFPSNQLIIADPAIMRGIRFTTVTLHPVQYNPARNVIRVISAIDCTLSQDSSNINPIRSTSLRTPGDFGQMAAAAMNYTPSTREEAPSSYLFICPDNTVQIIQTLAEWKQKLGFFTTITPMSEIGTTNTDLQNYLQNAYDTWTIPPEYVILFGDESGNFLCPTYYILGGFGWMDATDHPYTMLEGDDYFPDIFLGRISFQNQMQLMTAVSKIINYESNPYPGEWANSSLSLSYVLPSYNIYSHRETVMGVRNLLIADEFAVCDTFIHPYQHGNDTLADMINDGYSILNTRVTGSHDHWVNYTGYEFFDIQDVENLANGFMLPFVASITCGGGDFASHWEPTNFGETWLTAGTPAQPKGCIAFIGPTEYDTQTAWNNVLDTGIFDGFTNYDLRRCGQMLLHGKMALYNNYPYCHEMGNAHNSDQFYFHVYGLLGDPGLQVLSKAPQHLTLSAPDSLSWGTTYLDAGVSLPDGAPLAGAVIALTRKAELIATATTDENGMARIYASFLDKGIYTLTASCYNQRPESREIVVGQPSALALADITVLGPLSPNSTSQAHFCLENKTLDTISGMTLDLATSLPGITCSPASISIDSLAPNTSEDIQISIQCNGLWHPDTKVDFAISVESSVGMQEFHTLLQLHAPDAALVDYSIPGPDTCLVQNLQTDIQLQLYNAGDVVSDDFSCVVSSLDDNCQLVQSTAYFGSIPNGESAFGSIITLLPGDVITGQMAHLHLSIVQDNVEVFVTEASIPIGHISEDSPTFGAGGYIALESSDNGHPYIPQYNWIEIDPTLGGPGAEMGADHSTTDGFTKIVQLPFAFTYFHQFFQDISIHSNGWIAMGQDDGVFFRNRTIPCSTGPAGMIAPFWDHLNSGNVYLWHDAENHQFIVEWSGWYMADSYNADVENFQVILRDPQFYPSSSGNGEILIQYKDITNADSDGNYATIGIEDPTQTQGLLLTFANFDAPTFHPIAPEMAILFTSISTQPIPMLSTFEQNFSVQAQAGDTLTRQINLSNESPENISYNLHFSHFLPNGDTRSSRSIENDNIFLMGNSFVHYIQNDLLLYLIHNSPDGEAIYGVQLEFPDGVELTGATDIGTLHFNGEVGNAATASWGFGNGAPISPTVPQNFTLHCFVDASITNPITVNWLIQGDESGAEPHTKTGDFTLVPSGESYIWIHYPSGGEHFMYGLQDSVSWQHYGNFDTVNLDYSADEGHNWTTILENMPNTNHLTYTIPAPLTTMGKLRLRAGDDSCSGINNGLFSVSALTITYPIRQTTMFYESTDSLCWQDIGGIETVNVQLTRDDGISWETLASAAPNIGIFTFTVTSPPSEMCQLRITSEDGEIQQTSSRFEIADCPVAWVSSSISCNTLTPGETESIQITFNTAGLDVGDYTSYCIITSDIGQIITIPITLTVRTTAPFTAPILEQNRPNPFNPFTRIDYQLTAEARVKLKIYNSCGQYIRTLVNNTMSAGTHYAYWDGNDAHGNRSPSGIYYYQLAAGNKKQTKKMTLLK
ncbi:MAG: T9SS type A sorting domain-containing protein [Candidatus Cloacimonetes bacterium]|nr:T9SS type A sorting domain-containing protein [Candidatus Cloacimonadota bacterium]